MAKAQKHTLREIAKFASGLVVADFISALWLSGSDILPRRVWGIIVTDQIAYLGMGFDVLLFLILVHYAWHPRIMEPDVSRRGFFLFVGIVTGLVGILHLARLTLGVEVFVSGAEIPVWISWIGALVTLYISYASFHFMRK